MNAIEQLVLNRIAAKRAEDEAAEARRYIDQQIADLLRTEQVEGTVSQKAGDYKVSVTYKLTRKVDSESLSSVWESLSPEAKAAFKWSADVALAKYRALGDAELRLLSGFIESKPASPSIKIDVA